MLSRPLVALPSRRGGVTSSLRLLNETSECYCSLAIFNNYFASIRQFSSKSALNRDAASLEKDSNAKKEALLELIEKAEQLLGFTQVGIIMLINTQLPINNSSQGIGILLNSQI